MARVASAKRYAQAVFQISQERNELERWRLDLKRIAEVVGDPSLVALLESPKLHFSAKKGLLDERLGEINSLAMNFACLLVARGRLRIANQIAAEYERLADEYYGIEHAEVTTAIPLDEEDKARLSGRLGDIIGKKVVLGAHVDSAIIGGIVARMGDRLIDGSIRSKLEAMRKGLAGIGR